MNAVARLHGRRDVRIADEPVPQPGPGESLVRVEAVGLCGSDLHWYEDGGIGDVTLTAPVVPGHEFAGVVEGGPLDGRRVAVDPARPCGRCAQCRHGHQNLCVDVIFAGHGDCDGGLQQYIAWPTSELFALPDGFDGIDGAMLEPLGVALHALELGHVHVGATAAVVGCGPIGLLIIEALRAAGARTVVAIDPLEHRRAAALAAGAEAVAAPADAITPTGALAARSLSHRLAGGLEVDVAFEAAGTQDGVDAAIELARPGARVVLVGIPSDDRTSFRASPARRKGLTLVVARRMNDVYPRAIRLVADGLVDVRRLVSHRFPLARAAEAFDVAAARAGVKVVVEPVSRGT